MKRVLCAMLCLCFLALLLSSCGSGATTMKLIRTEGEVGVRDGGGKDVPVREDLDLYAGYHISTRPVSYAWINLDDVKLAKMDECSETEIQKEGKALEITVHSGSLFFNITEPLAADESMDIRTATVIAGIRGTCGWVEYVSEHLVRLSLLEGVVACRTADGEVLAEVHAGEQADFTVQTDGSVLYASRPLYESDLPAFVTAEALPAGVVYLAGAAPAESGALLDGAADGEVEDGLPFTSEDYAHLLGDWYFPAGNGYFAEIMHIFPKDGRCWLHSTRVSDGTQFRDHPLVKIAENTYRVDMGALFLYEDGALSIVFDGEVRGRSTGPGPY